MNAKLFTAFFAVLSLPVFAQNRVVKGRVLSDRTPVEFATVVVAGTNNGATTNAKGEYFIALPHQTAQELVTSMIGYTTVHSYIPAGSDTVTLLIRIEPTPSKLNEIVVTGMARGAELRKSPIPIVALSRKEMETNINNNIIDAIAQGVAGVNAVTTGPNISKPFIRGLGYNRVLCMYDGLRQEGQQWGDEHGIELDQYGVERAEVVKGPASLIYGSDALAGVINMIPYFPKGMDGKLKGDAVIDYHTNNGMVGASVGMGYKKGDWGYQFRASQKMAHDYQNQVDGLVYNTGFREYNIAATVGVVKKWGKSMLSATLYDNWQEIPDGSRDSLSRRFTQQTEEAAHDDIKHRQQVPDAVLRSYDIAAVHQRIQHYRIYSHNTIELGNAGEIQATVGYQRSVRREYNHPTMPAQPGLNVLLDTWNYDVKYNAPTWKGIAATVGINGMYQSNEHGAATDFPIPSYDLLDMGAFLYAKKSVGRLDISGGIRYDLRNVNWNDFYVVYNQKTGFTEQAKSGAIAGASLQFPSFSRQYTGMSGSIGATYNCTDKIVIKANAARGYRAPNITESGSNGLDPGAHIVYMGNRNFDPEFALQEDLGLIGSFKDFDFSVEVFNNNIDNIIYMGKLYDGAGKPVVIVPGNITYQFQQSRAQLYGGELGLNMHPSAVSWLKWDNSIAYVAGLNRNDAMIALYGNAARYLPFVPPLQVRSELKATRKQQIGRFTGLYIRASVAYNAAQHQYYGVDNTETPTDAYTLWGAGCGATMVTKDGADIFKIYFQAENITDVAYQSNMNRLKYFEYYTAAPNGKSGIYNMGRNLSLKIIVPF